ncbi:beta-ketoacyl-[acyl-carrier-protein] synthase family protein [Allomuricauda sp. SCSIO 65647]|uniref:beta-ketoacyl-[acyl-carrier-protein] synthase family protein n=1 Tax=Allomuricauda sp. SCSIO 65647 TaxID=2908843 RepID=UPI001F187CAE|nr:beta-ketoacyl-[acyl-carrier-protein] synthase family protein [Muricauda sp. SCSIO 65647]UJH67395.1 beta-ketoacyl-[acyl-carrier-protein] synthase family protein [Muricauda sp. SCSIO 65647]
MQNRVVVTGLGVCAPGGVGLRQFEKMLSEGKSGITFFPELEKLKFGCQIAGKPFIDHIDLNQYFTNVQLKGLNASGLVYGVMAGMDAWRDARLDASNNTDWETGVIFGTGILGVDKFRDSIYLVDEGNVRRLGSTAVVQTMASGISAFLGGMIGAGNQVTTNSSACSTGTEALLMGFERIASGQASKMLVGSCSDSGPYVWGGFDAMRILPRNFNDTPEKASRPMSASAAGFVPGSGAGALVLESLESAQQRGATIYAELLGGAVNSGGQRNGGSMTAPNSEAVQRCVKMALENTKVSSSAIDTINGHLTATAKDPIEIENWCQALDRHGEDFPYVNSFKGHVGHCLAAAGSIESVGAVLQLHHGTIYGNVNGEDVHPEIAKRVGESKIPKKTINISPKIVAKASFGFGDVNTCVIFSRFSDY